MAARAAHPNVTRREKAREANLPGQIGAGDGIRTRDPELGKLVLYQLSYTRERTGAMA